MKTKAKSAKAPKNKATKSAIRTVVAKEDGTPRRTSLFFENPKNGNLVCYQRAHQLGLTHKKGIKSGIKNPKSNRFISPTRAKQMGLLKKAA